MLGAAILCARRCTPCVFHAGASLPSRSRSSRSSSAARPTMAAARARRGHITSHIYITSTSTSTSASTSTSSAGDLACRLPPRGRGQRAERACTVRPFNFIKKGHNICATVHTLCQCAVSASTHHLHAAWHLEIRRADGALASRRQRELGRQVTRRVARRLAAGDHCGTAQRAPQSLRRRR